MFKSYYNKKRFQKKKIILITSISLWAIGLFYWYFKFIYIPQQHQHHEMDEIMGDHSIYNLHDGFYKEIEHNQKLPTSTTSTLSVANADQTVTPNPANQNHLDDEQQLKVALEEYENEQYRLNTEDFRYNNTFLNLLKNHLNLNKENDQFSTIYDLILKDHSLISILKNLNFNQRCDLFFKHIYLQNQNWNFNPNEDYTIYLGEEGLNEFKEGNFKVLKYKFFKQLKSPPKSIYEINDDDEKLNEFIINEYTNKIRNEKHKKMIDNISIFRIFNKCYITNDKKDQIETTNKFINKQKQFIENLNNIEDNDKNFINNDEKFSYNKFEKLVSESHIGNKFQHRLYPWLSFENPIFERWTGQIINYPPNFRTILKDKSQPINKEFIKDSKSIKDLNFFKNFKNQCNGKGIVLTVANIHVDYVINLIHLLRSLNNKLPIQIIYFNDLNNESKKKIVTAAREKFNSLPNSFENVSESFTNLNPEEGLPKQEIWFVNIANVINENYKEKFHGFSNKILATLFNSFNDFMLIDADTVMMKPPEFFFNLRGYLKTGTLFFKDRSILEKRPAEDKILFKKLSPSTIDSIMFNIPILTNYTLNLGLFIDLWHQMESGMVLINKSLHFNSILMINHINLFSNLRDKSYGDKELFWLGFAINGDENFYFNKLNAASIGVITSNNERTKPDGSPYKSKEICSSHPGHINDEDNHSLLWINSGFKFCHQSSLIDFNKESSIGGDKLKFLEPDPEVYEKFYNIKNRKCYYSTNWK
ncbi:uncharacterized protein KGF55_005746 [Candida pseudojiufengensis]|uniref:uncharacterized protein n=1 Tax=Candida pseudojiufengensis TaxID=497109 RepID=UPI0022249D75|nr:uncharacterized protein KGF55_005746 [Candida pseudojiufengensis]KAI5958747.1 hypothetical protein KGF55_005746 [Candida pseudojiufengensis]